jgi:hypothetical protein
VFKNIGCWFEPLVNKFAAYPAPFYKVTRTPAKNDVECDGTCVREKRKEDEVM